MNPLNSYSSPTPSRELQLPASLDGLQSQIDRLRKVSEELCARLEKICRPEGPTQAAPPQQEQGPPQAEYVENIHGKIAQIRRVCEMLEYAMSRLEV